MKINTGKGCRLVNLPKAFALVVCAALMSSLFVLLPTFTWANEAQVTPSRGANFRAGPSMNSEVFRALPRGTRVQVVERAEGGWLRVRVNGRDGFMAGNLLSGQSSGPSTIASPPSFLVVSPARGANFRASPTTQGRRIQALPAGSRVRARGPAQGNWLPVSVNGQQGYIARNLLRDAGPSTVSSSPSQTTSIPARVTARRGLRLRSTPGGGQTLTVIPRNARVEVTGLAEGDWVPVQVGSSRGFMHVSYLRAEDGQRLAGQETTVAGVGLLPCRGDCGRRDLLDHAQSILYASLPGRARMNQLSNISWRQAVRVRNVARFMGGGRRGGNRSKGMCAAAVKDALLEAGVCRSRPPGHAHDLHRRGNLARHCNVSRTNVTDPRQAPVGSIIVYSGYAGNRPHNYGHVETVVEVTPEILQDVRRSGLSSVRVGQRLYCSDYCRATPTHTPNNPVAAIYRPN